LLTSWRIFTSLQYCVPVMRAPAETISGLKPSTPGNQRFQISMAILAFIVALGLGLIFLFMITTNKTTETDQPESHSVSVSSESPCICIMEYDPLCGSDGVTYTNNCFLKCAQEKNPGMQIIFWWNQDISAPHIALFYDPQFFNDYRYSCTARGLLLSSIWDIKDQVTNIWIPYYIQ